MKSVTLSTQGCSFFVFPEDQDAIESAEPEGSRHGSPDRCFTHLIRDVVQIALRIRKFIVESGMNKISEEKLAKHGDLWIDLPGWLDLNFSLEDFVEVDGVTDDDGHSDQCDDEHHLECQF